MSDRLGIQDLYDDRRNNEDGPCPYKAFSFRNASSSKEDCRTMEDFVEVLYWIAVAPWMVIAAFFGWVIFLTLIGSIWEALK